MKITSLLALNLISAVAFASEPAAPTDGSSELLKSIVRATPIDRISPEYPRKQARKGHEGWAKVSFVIEPDGSVSNAFIVDSSGVASFEEATLKATKQWKFAPATQNGKPIQQCVNIVQMDYRIEGNSHAASRKFVRKYKAVVEAFDAKDFKQAEALLDQMDQNKNFSLYEDRLFWLLNAYYHQHLADDANALKYFRRAAYNIEGGDNRVYLNTMENTFILEVKSKYFADALDTFDHIKATERSEEVVKRLQPYQQKVVDIINNQQFISVPAIVGERGFASYKLARQRFELSVLSGKVDKIEVFCDNKQNTFTYAADSSWTIPKSWGRCALYVYGAKDSQFNVVEYPKTL